ncbi:MAG: twin-arginine translocase TatA/TatE family subunit [Bacteroidales bacterium]|jgi:sec-independent protein translocase protein TatA|nr:twin-arginine translocase TatA/TatE family subunit [Bacteroidales bacterium]MDD2204661.1 twin-arginine translocase TatA/TatE family subunit [Bacteroidales bacterium]MDD3151316.1 twin-arginine translocase TatA/TatE family subunit [Bacteroidales bacterium]MDD3913664.1 twin-arginine translocase TatA/TatE family subunit [Bacteroidales bacterium]MDD4633915.1 twin-arginine translocase TatA/TatE family subunit [Bacteroidales bacterium]
MSTTATILGFLGGWEIALIVLIILILFGGKKIPELMKGLGKGVKNFKEGMKEGEEEVDEDGNQDTKKL